MGSRWALRNVAHRWDLLRGTGSWIGGGGRSPWELMVRRGWPEGTRARVGSWPKTGAGGAISSNTGWFRSSAWDNDAVSVSKTLRVSGDGLFLSVRGISSFSLPISSARSVMARLERPKTFWRPRTK